MAKKIYDIGQMGSPGGRPAPPPPAPRPRPRAQHPAAGPRPGSHVTPASPVVLFLAYVTGPFGPLATGQGWSRPAWRTFSLIGGFGWIATALLWIFAPRILAWGAPMVAVWAAAIVVLTTLGSIAWARGVRWAQQEVHVGGLPSSVRHPLTGGLGGFLIPGLAHTLTYRSKRAVAILAVAGPLVASVLVTLRAREIWRSNHADSTAALFTDAQLELALIACAAVAVFAVLSWLAQAFDGLRVASISRGIDGSWVSGFVMLLVAAGGLLVAVQHQAVAERLDRAATRFERADFTQVPLWLWESARFLDASEPVYALRAARLHERAGDEIEAASIRRDLERRWEAYREEVAAGDPSDDAATQTAERVDETWPSVGFAPGRKAY